MKNRQGIIWLPLLMIIGAVVVAGFVGYFLIQANGSGNENMNVAVLDQVNNNASVNANTNSSVNTNQVANNNANVNTNTPVNTNTTTNQNANTNTKSTTQIKGWLLIYNRDDPAPTLNGQVFDPNVWYVSPREVDFPGNRDVDYKLDLSSAICAYPDSTKTDSCNGSQVRWGYGDRVVVDGILNSGKLIDVSTMTAVSGQPVEQW